MSRAAWACPSPWSRSPLWADAVDEVVEPELELPLERGRCGLGLVPVEVTGDVWVVPDGDLHGDLTFPQGGLAGWRSAGDVKKHGADGVVQQSPMRGEGG